MSRAAPIAAVAFALAAPAAAEDFRVDPETGNNKFDAVFDAKLGERITAQSSSVSSARLRTPARGDLRDLAALEWARTEVFFEAATAPVGREALVALGPDAFLLARLELVPPLRVVLLDHDAATLWRRLEDGEPPGAPLRGPTAVAVWRTGFEVFHGRIHSDEARALEAVRARATLAEGRARS